MRARNVPLRNRRKTYLRNRPPYDIKAILFYGLPVWIGALIAGWFFDGWSGLISIVIGLVLLGAYIAISLFFVKRFDKLRSDSVGKAISAVMIGFFVRLAMLWLATFLVIRSLEVNLILLATTIGVGFTIIMLITIIRNALE